LDGSERVRATKAIVERLLCLLAVAASAYGLDRDKARAWLEQENLWSRLTESEDHFIRDGKGDASRFIVQIEGMWALAWSLGLVGKLDFSEECDSKFVTMLPNLKIGERSDELRSRVKFRAVDDILAACDLSFCLHWAIRQAQLTGTKLPSKVQPYVIEERRRALEWLVNDDQWSDGPLDT
jgi:hypothetical protein